MKEDAPVYPNDEADTRLYNLEHLDDDDINIYIGDENHAYNLQPSPFRNPYRTTEYGRFEAVEHYRMYFYHRYLEEPEFRKQAHELEHDDLGCWCYPDACHGTVIADLLNEHISGGDTAVYQHIQEKIDEADPEKLTAEGFKHKEKAEELLESVE